MKRAAGALSRSCCASECRLEADKKALYWREAQQRTGAHTFVEAERVALKRVAPLGDVDKFT